MGMSDKPRSSSRFVIGAVLLFCAGAGAWYYANEGFLSKEEAAVQVSAEQPVSAGASAATSELTGAKDAAEHVEASAHQVTGTLNSGPRPRQISAEEKRDARVEKALVAKGRMEGGDSVAGSLSEVPVRSEKAVQDTVVTPYFVSDLAVWLAESYKPALSEGRKGQSTVTLRSANARYSISPTLRSAEGDALKGRRAVLRYVYSAGMLEALYRMYAPRFMGELESSAQSGRCRLSQEQTADMFFCYGEKLKAVATALEAAARLDIRVLVKPIRQAASKEEAASAAFSKAYAAHSEAREAGRKDVMAGYSERMVQSIRAASDADARKIRLRQNVVGALRQNMEECSLSDADLIFLAEWLGRRNASPEAISASADICRRLADAMRKRAAELAAL